MNTRKRQLVKRALTGLVTMATFFAVLLAFGACRQAPNGGNGGDRGARTADTGNGNGNGGQLSPAEHTYVAPGEKDDYYLFHSGGHSGQVFVHGMPSMRHIATIPVFTPYPGTGYGFDDESEEMLGEYSWGDVHHPNISKTDGKYDGRWLFVNDNANNRMARISLNDFKTKQIIDLPNVMGAHCSSFITDNSEYILYGTRFSVPFPTGTYEPVSNYEEEYQGVVGAVAVDQETGEMTTPWQIVTPPFNWDLGATGHGPSQNWGFWTSYNSEMATGKLEVTTAQSDRDYTLMVNWKKVREVYNQGDAGEMVNGVRVFDPTDVEGAMFFLPTGKSPHGVDVAPNGKWIVASGKLKNVTTVYNMEKIQTAIENEDYARTVRDIPVLNYDSVMEKEVEVGLGPLHTQFDGEGNAYTTLFIDSQVAKWELGGDWEVLDKIDMSYNPGHLMIPGGDTVDPYGEYLVSLNKLSHGRHISVGPSQPEASQLVDISGEDMRLLEDAFTEPEPHYAMGIPADELDPIEVYDLEEHNQDPDKVTSIEEARVERTGPNKVEVWVALVRSSIYPHNVEVEQGDTVEFHITNIEQTTDELHGFALNAYDANIVVDPGETKHYTVEIDEKGVYPYYCTNFCSALHQEMQGYLTVKPSS